MLRLARAKVGAMPIRLLAVVLAILLLPACAAEFRPPGPPVTAAALGHDHWRAADGAILPVRTWLPAGRVRAVVLALHGMNDYSNAFAGPGQALAAKGIAVVAYDQRGFGRGPHPGYWSGTRAMAADLRTATALVAARFPGVPLYLLGESMGGAVVMVTVAARPPPAVKGIILAAPAVWARNSMTVFERAALWLAFEVAPGLELTGEGLNIQASDNIPMLRRLSLDPLVIKATRVDAIEGLVELMDRAAAAAPDIRVPTLVLYGAHDQIIPPEAAQAMVAQLRKTASPCVAVYPQGWHMLLRDLDAATVIGDVAAWIADPARPLPSGADRHARSALARLAQADR